MQGSVLVLLCTLIIYIYKYCWHSIHTRYQNVDMLMIFCLTIYALLQNDADAVGHWSTSNHFNFNCRKCNPMVFLQKEVSHASYSPLPYCANWQPVEIVDSVKHLGLTIWSNLSQHKYISHISAKARNLVGILFHHIYSSPVQTLTLSANIIS